MRHCARCHYDLRDLPAGLCPECGRVFDPADEATYLARVGWLQTRWPVVLSLTATILPLLCWLMMQLTWLLATLCLGHRPRPSMDDPKSIAAIAPFYLATLMLIPLALAGAMAMPLIACVHRTWRRAVVLGGVGVALIVIGIGLLRWDPFDVAEWFMD